MLTIDARAEIQGYYKIPVLRSSHQIMMTIGGHEDKYRDRSILKTLVSLLGENKMLAVATLASAYPDEYWKEYEPVLRSLGAEPIHIHVRDRIDASSRPILNRLREVGGILVTGGDQLRARKKIADTPFAKRLQEIPVYAGTSAGGALPAHIMAHENQFVPGLALMASEKPVIIDTHLTQRNRRRLEVGIQQHRDHVAIGLDEDTAIIWEGPKGVVIGSGTVNVFTYSDLQAGDQTYSEDKKPGEVLRRGQPIDIRKYQRQRIVLAA